jgi:hypothetical protein
MKTMKMISTVSILSMSLIGVGCTSNKFSDLPAHHAANQNATATTGGAATDTGGTTDGNPSGDPSGNPSVNPNGDPTTISTGANPPAVTIAQVACKNSQGTYGPLSSTNFAQANLANLNECMFVVTVSNATQCSYLPVAGSPEGEASVQDCSGGTYTYHFTPSSEPVPYMGVRTFSATGAGGTTSIKYESRCLDHSCNFGLVGQVSFPSLPMPSASGALPSVGAVQFACLNTSGAYGFLGLDANTSNPYYYQGRGGGLDNCEMIVGLSNSSYALYYPGVSSLSSNPQSPSSTTFTYQFAPSSTPTAFNGVRDFYAVNPQGYVKVTYEAKCQGTICAFSTVSSATYSSATE